MKPKLAQTGHDATRGPECAQIIDPEQLPDALTIDILRGLARGQSNREIALELHISVRTLCRLLASVRELWQVDTTMEAVVIAARLTLL